MAPKQSRLDASVGPAAKKRKTQSGSAKDTSSAPPPQPLTRPPAKTCLRCSAAPSSGKRWYYTKKNGVDPLDNKCFDCYSSFLAAWQHSHSWESLCQQCEEDAELASTFAVSVLVHGGEAPGWQQSEVDKHSSHSLTISRNLVGLSHDEFRSLYAGYNPEQLGFRSVQLPSYTGQTFRMRRAQGCATSTRGR